MILLVTTASYHLTTDLPLSIFLYLCVEKLVEIEYSDKTKNPCVVLVSERGVVIIPINIVKKSFLICPIRHYLLALDNICYFSASWTTSSLSGYKQRSACFLLICAVSYYSPILTWALFQVSPKVWHFLTIEFHFVKKYPESHLVI